MEKLVVIYKDGGQLRVSNKNNGTMLPYFRNRVGYRPGIKSAVITRTQCKGVKYKPLVLIKDGVAVANDPSDLVVAN